MNSIRRLMKPLLRAEENESNVIPSKLSVVDLPDNILEDIVRNLNFDDILKVRLVCRRLEQVIPWMLWVRNMERQQGVGDAAANGFDYDNCSRDDLLRRYRMLRFTQYCPLTNKDINFVWTRTNSYFGLVPYLNNEERSFQQIEDYYSSHRHVFEAETRFKSVQEDLPCLRLKMVCWMECQVPLPSIDPGYYSVSYLLRVFIDTSSFDFNMDSSIQIFLVSSTKDEDSAVSTEKLGIIRNSYWDSLALNEWKWTPKVYFQVKENARNVHIHF